MANQKNGGGCAGVLLLFFLIWLISAICVGIARGSVDAVVWIRYGPGGLPAGVAQQALYPYAWTFFFCVLGVLAVAAGTARYEVVRRRRYRRYLAAEAAVHARRLKEGGTHGIAG